MVSAHLFGVLENRTRKSYWISIYPILRTGKSNETQRTERVYCTTTTGVGIPLQDSLKYSNRQLIASLAVAKHCQVLKCKAMRKCFVNHCKDLLRALCTYGVRKSARENSNAEKRKDKDWLFQCYAYLLHLNNSWRFLFFFSFPFVFYCL